MTIFVIRDGELVLDSDEILTIPQFAKIYKNDKTKDKQNAFKRFAYIYQMCDYKSLPNQEGYSEKEAHKYSVEVADLPADYRPSSDVVAAMKEYKKMRYNVLRESVLELKKSFKTIINVIGNARVRLNDNINNDMDGKTEEEKNAIIAASIELITKLISLSTSLNKQIEELGKTLAKIHKEETESKEGIVRGDTEYTTSLDGDPDIEGY